MKTTPLVLVLALGSLAACAPNTLIRRTAFIPAATAPARVGLPLEKGQIRLEGQANAVSLGDTIRDGSWLHDEFPDVGDPGVLIPNVQLGASLYFGLPRGLELGFQVGYTSMDWSRRNAAGVLPFPEAEQRDLFSGGIGARYTFPLRDPHMVLAIITQLDITSVPEAIFECVDPDRCSSGQFSDDVEANEIYAFRRVDDELFFLPNLAFQFGYRAIREVLPYVMLGVESSVKNTGFENDPATLPDDTLESFLVGYVGVGVDVDIQGFVFGASFYLPFEGEDRIDFGPSFAFKLGGRFGPEGDMAQWDDGAAPERGTND